MTVGQLHDILDNDNKKLSKDEICQVIYELRNDTLSLGNKEYEVGLQKYYYGESNAFQIVLDLLEHLEV